MPANKMTISWETSMPATGLKPNSIYIIDPGAGNLPQVFVTNKLGSASYRINPTTDLSAATMYLVNIVGVVDIYNQTLAPTVVNFTTA